ncbi:DNA-directed RNA polymerase III, subunit Rpc31 [Truncatella angustata]|uniref:DNA-directed RNA polymerase III subunit n=1 Tax=Truncatella angustata TaxID=152316 RepID=A0A9P9A2L8_9PEZI|nr:DNA-directed RNA polymerase III, subunit Rpc31 [Truncatella angustata]KAH6660841.1 DNA-directed RNA polymerase III, subunit Rpc31 [Truncatella angustata]KAH8196909.1 hypothetical protein TruAng_008934 [Truncatella angustata]
MASRGGGRGGGRGGRGGARGGKGGASGLPWDYDPTTVSNQPQETYPKTYRPPLAASFPLTPSESRSVRYFVKFRRDFHNSPLYTHKHLATEAVGASISDPIAKTYGQEQVNERYGINSRATIDPFTAVPMFTHQFVSETRPMPYLRGRDWNHDLFPEELWPTLDGKDGGPAKDALAKATKRKSVAADNLPDDEDDDGMRKRPETDEERRRRIEEAAMGGENEDAADEEEDEEGELEDPDDDFEEDEDGGDYDAEQYFENGDDDEGDDGGGDGGEY